MTPQIVVFSRSASTLMHIASTLSGNGFRITTVKDIPDTVAGLKQHEADLIILGYEQALSESEVALVQSFQANRHGKAPSVLLLTSPTATLPPIPGVEVLISPVQAELLKCVKQMMGLSTV